MATTHRQHRDGWTNFRGVPPDLIGTASASSGSMTLLLLVDEVMVAVDVPGCHQLSGTGDPVGWSPASVEIPLGEWIPKTIGGVVERLSKAMGMLDRDVPWSTPFDHDPWPAAPYDNHWSRSVDEEPFSYNKWRLDSLEATVGGEAALESLHDEPLPDETFAWDGIEADIASRVGQVVTLCDRFADDKLDTEYRTAFRRFLAKVAVGDAELFRRPGTAETEEAAAVCWSVGKANNLFVTNDDQRLLVREMMGYFGLSGTAAALGRTMITAGGFPNARGDLTLGSPAYLVSRRRRQIMAQRDKIEARTGW